MGTNVATSPKSHFSMLDAVARRSHHQDPRAAASICVGEQPGGWAPAGTYCARESGGRSGSTASASPRRVGVGRRQWQENGLLEGWMNYCILEHVSDLLFNIIILWGPMHKAIRLCWACMPVTISPPSVFIIFGEEVIIARCQHQLHECLVVNGCRLQQRPISGLSTYPSSQRFAYTQYQ